MPPDADNSATEESLDQVKTIFRQAAEAVVFAQRTLDGELNPAYLSACEVRGHPRLYSIPRASINFCFGLIITKQKKLIIIPKGDPRLEQQTHQLMFSLYAAPEPPPRLTVAAATTTAPDDAAEDLPPIYVREPFFLVPAKEEAKVCARLISALGSGLAGSWVSAVPGSSGGVKYLSQAFVTAETINIAKAMLNTTSERGMVLFRYEGTPASYLIVRVVGRDANDSVFVLTPGAQPEAIIYSIDGDNTKEISYKPLHHFTYTIRRWLQGELPSTIEEHSEDTGLQFGLQYLQPFAQNMRSGYIDALRYLSGMEDVVQPDDEPARQRAQPSAVYYDLSDVSAQLSYSLEFKSNGGAGAEVNLNFDSFQAADAQGQGDDVALLGSRVLIRAKRENNLPRLEVEVSTPEFALSGAPLKKFLGIATQSVEAIVKAFGNDRRYAGFIKDETYQRGVVALLSYRGSLKEEFLVIWPGEDQGRSRDFAFTCGLDEKKVDDAQVLMLDEIAVVMRVSEPLAAVQIGTDTGGALGAEMTGKQYRVFHNFFHAVRIWRARFNPPKK